MYILWEQYLFQLLKFLDLYLGIVAWSLDLLDYVEREREYIAVLLQDFTDP